MLRNSLGPLAEEAGRPLPADFAERRPEQLAPAEFVGLARALFGKSEGGEEGTRGG
jgi:hypothetical protein